MGRESQSQNDLRGGDCSKTYPRPSDYTSYGRIRRRELEKIRSKEKKGDWRRKFKISAPTLNTIQEDLGKKDSKGRREGDPEMAQEEGLRRRSRTEKGEDLQQLQEESSIKKLEKKSHGRTKKEIQVDVGDKVPQSHRIMRRRR